jgi:hypothetical protein
MILDGFESQSIDGDTPVTSTYSCGPVFQAGERGSSVAAMAE